MDAVRIEHLLAGALGVQVGQRGKSNDADAVRSGNPKYLVKAVEGALKNLKRRVERLQDDDSILRQARIGDLVMTIDSIKKREDEIIRPSCFYLWSVFAVALDMIDMELKERGV